MIESGIIVGMKNGWARIKVSAQQGCEKCSAAGFCNYLGENTRVMEAANPIGAKVGEEVKIFVPSRYTLISAILIFLVPILFSLVGVIIGTLIFKREVFQIIGGISGIVLGIVVVKLIDIRMKKKGKLRPRIMNVIKKSNNLFLKNN